MPDIKLFLALNGKVNWMYTKKVDKYDKIEDKQRRQKNVRKEKQ